MNTFDMESRLERQLRLVELARARGPFRFKRGMEELALISTATLTRLLGELQATGMLSRLSDGSYGVGERPTAWAIGHDESVPAATSMILDNLRDELSCTVTLWTIHAQAQRCCYRALDEYSPAFAQAGVIRPLVITAGAGGLFCAPEQLSDLDSLRAQTARTPLTPKDAIIKRIVRGCIHDRVFDDQGAMYAGCRRLAVPINSESAIACAFAATRLSLLAERQSALAAMHSAATSLS